MHFSVSPLGIPRIFRKIHFDWSYFLQDTAGFTANTEYIDYSLDSERKTRILRKIIRRSSEMAKIAIPAQETSEKSEKSLYFCALIEEINLNPFIDIVGYTTKDHHPEQEIQAISIQWTKYKIYILHVKLHVFFSVEIPIGRIFIQ